MKIIAACMVANEADIIEAFLRHHSRFLDAIVVLNHRSIDRTPEIVAQLVKEGLPIVLLHDGERAYRQSERMTYLAKRYLAELGADFCFLLDADEFLRCDSRVALENALGALPPAAQGLVATQNYYGVGGDPQDVNPVRRLTRRLIDERRLARKIVVRRGFDADPQALVSMGNHAALRLVEGRPQPLAHAPVDGVTLAHFPVRSPEQIAKKALIGWLAYRMTQPAAPAQGRGAPAWHWREIFRLISSGEVGVDGMLMDRAIGIVAGGESQTPVQSHELLDDPIDAPYTLRYTDAQAAAPLSALALWADALVSAA